MEYRILQVFARFTEVIAGRMEGFMPDVVLYEVVIFLDVSGSKRYQLLGKTAECLNVPDSGLKIPVLTTLTKMKLKIELGTR